MIDPIIIRLTKRLRQIAREMDKHSKYMQGYYHITLPQLVCLQEIYKYGPISLGALTKIISLNNSTITGIVDRLEKRNLVRRIRISKDRRQIHVEITDEGIAFIEKAPAPMQRRFVEKLASLGEEEIQEILAAIEKLVYLFGSDEMRKDRK